MVTPPQQSVSLFSTIAVKKALDEVICGAFTQDTGTAVVAVYEPTHALLERIAAGARPEVLIGLTSQLEPLGQAGVVDLSTRVPVARVRVGVATAADVPIPDISSVRALITVLVNARSVAYSRSGASGVYFAGLLQRLGIAEQVNKKATIIETGFTAEAVVDGRADIAVQLLSEHRCVLDARIIGPLPEEIQQVTEFSAVLGAAAATRPESRSLIRYLTSTRAQEAYRHTGMEAAQSAATT